MIRYDFCHGLQLPATDVRFSELHMNENEPKHSTCNLLKGCHADTPIYGFSSHNTSRQVAWTQTILASSWRSQHGNRRYDLHPSQHHVIPRHGCANVDFHATCEDIPCPPSCSRNPSSRPTIQSTSWRILSPMNRRMKRYY